MNNNYWLKLTAINKSEPVKKTRNSLDKQKKHIKNMINKYKNDEHPPYVHPNNKPESKRLKLNKKKFT